MKLRYIFKKSEIDTKIRKSNLSMLLKFALKVKGFVFYALKFTPKFEKVKKFFHAYEFNPKFEKVKGFVHAFEIYTKV